MFFILFIVEKLNNEAEQMLFLKVVFQAVMEKVMNKISLLSGCHLRKI